MKKDQTWLFGLVVVVAIIGLSIWGFNKRATVSTDTANNGQTVTPIVAGESDGAKAEYFSEDASVMFFYSDYCSWCNKEKEVLKELAKDNYRVKPMNVGTDQSLWEKYSIKGTPTFIAKNGDRVEGYKEKDDLKKWLDEHK